MRPARLDHTFFEDEPRSHLGALLLRKGLVSNTELDRALEERQSGELLGEALVRLRICFEDDIARVLGEQAQVEFADINVISVDHRAVALLPFELAEALRAIPIRLHPSGELSVAAVDPTDQSLLPQLKLATGHPIRLLVTTPSALRAAWKTAYNA
jgi:hypothetical protein